jgi:transcriptional regulator with XRE-family HTH domain
MKGENNAERLRIMRKQLNMTQNKLAKKLFIARPTLTNYETGRKQIPEDILKHAEQICNEHSA